MFGEKLRPPDTPRRRVEVPATCIPEIVLREGGRSGTRGSSSIIHETGPKRKSVQLCAGTFLVVIAPQTQTYAVTPPKVSSSFALHL